MKFLVFLFFLVIFYILKAVASIGQGTVEIARSAYETVYKKPEKENKKKTTLYASWEALLIKIEEVMREEIEKNLELYKTKLIKTEEDKELFIFFLTVERFLLSVYFAEGRFRKICKNRDIIETAIASLAFRYYKEKLYNISQSDLFVLYSEIYSSNRKEFYQEQFERYQEPLQNSSGTVLAILCTECLLLSDKIVKNFAIESYKYYKKELTINKYIKYKEKTQDVFFDTEKTMSITEYEYKIFNYIRGKLAEV